MQQALQAVSACFAANQHDHFAVYDREGVFMRGIHLHDVFFADAGLDVTHKHRLRLHLGHSGDEGGYGALGGCDTLVLPRGRQHLKSEDRKTCRFFA